jgi:hypothetical protein
MVTQLQGRPELNSLKRLCTRLILPAVVAVAFGAFLDTTLADDVSLPGLERNKLSRIQVAYNNQRYPVYQKVHRAPTREKAEFARLEEKSDADEATAEQKHKAHGHHRRAPYGARMGY